MAEEIDTSAFHALSYGLYVISTKRAGRNVGCVVNTFAQVTSSPAQASIAINKENFTTGGIEETGYFEASVLAESAPMELIGTFGFHSSADTDKFADIDCARDAQEILYPKKHVASRFLVKVEQRLDLGSHVLFIGSVVEAEVLSKEAPMTYAFYHQVKGGKTPPKASSFDPNEGVVSIGEKRTAWRCSICGHIEYVDELPDDFVCPVCGVGKDLFERIEV